MRVRPDGVELLRAARVTLGTAIAPHLSVEHRDALNAVEQAVALGAERLARDQEASAADLAMLDEARATMRGRLLEALPEERRYDARLIAKAIAVVTRQLANGHLSERQEYERLCALLDTPAAADASASAIRCALPALNGRLGARIRLGEADVGTTTYAATLAHLEAITNEALSESNPTYRRPAPAPVPTRDDTTQYTAPPASVAAVVSSWNGVPRAVQRAFTDTSPTTPLSHRVEAWRHLYGTFGEALCASGSAAFATQADLLGWFARRLAANPRVPMAAVESAHQAHDLSVAVADASAALFELAFAPFGIGHRRSEAVRVP